VRAMEQLKELLAPDEGRDALRKLGGLLLGVGMLLIFFRKGSENLGAQWGDFALFLVLLAPCVFLYGLGFIGRRVTDGLRAWEAVYLTFGLFFVPLVLFQFVELVNGNPGASLNVFWIFLVTDILAVVAALVAGARYLLLLASLAMIVWWSALWDKIIGIGDHLGTYRGLLLVLAAIMVVGAVGLYVMDREGGLPRANELVTGAGISAVLGSIGLSATVLAAESNPFTSVPIAKPSAFWNLVALAVSLLLILYGARFGARGPVYVGGVGLFLFVLIVGLDLGHEPPKGSLKWWPVITVLLGAIAFVLSVIPGLRVNIPTGREPPSETGRPPPPPPSSGSQGPP
jgi:hypothetical protein